MQCKIWYVSDLLSVDSDTADTKQHSKHPFITKCESSQVTEFIQRYVMTAYLKSESRRELHYILPYEEAKKGNFEKLFDALETQQGDLFIASYGVADSTLEEVFLEVTQNASKEAEGNYPYLSFHCFVEPSPNWAELCIFSLSQNAKYNKDRSLAICNHVYRTRWNALEVTG